MRRIFFLILALTIVLVVCTGLLLYRPSIWPEAAARIGVNSPPPSHSTGRESPFAVPETKQIGAKLRTISSTPNFLQSSEPPLSRSSGIVAGKHAFPTGTEINIGLSKADLLGRFGPPEVTVTGSDFGRLYERMIYRERSTGKKTVIVLVDGKVAGAETFATDERTESGTDSR